MRGRGGPAYKKVKALGARDLVITRTADGRGGRLWDRVGPRGTTWDHVGPRGTMRDPWDQLIKVISTYGKFISTYGKFWPPVGPCGTSGTIRNHP